MWTVRMTTKMDGITQNQNQKTIDAVIATRSHEAMLPKALECTGDPYGGGEPWRVSVKSRTVRRVIRRPAASELHLVERQKWAKHEQSLIASWKCEPAWFHSSEWPSQSSITC